MIHRSIRLGVALAAALPFAPIATPGLADDGNLPSKIETKIVTLDQRTGLVTLANGTIALQLAVRDGDKLVALTSTTKQDNPRYRALRR